MKCTYYGYLFLLSNLCCAAFGFEDTSTIYVITATVPNQLQLPRLIRLGNTLNLIENLYWIIVSGSPLRAEVKDYLQRLKTPVVQVVGKSSSYLRVWNRFYNKYYMQIPKVLSMLFLTRQSNGYMKIHT